MRALGGRIGGAGPVRTIWPVNEAAPPPPPARPERVPAPLLVAASLATLEGLLLIVQGVVEVFSLSSARVTMGLTTALFFLLYGGGLVVAAWALSRLNVFARAPIVLAQLIQLLVAWSFWGGATQPVAIGLAVVAVLVLAGVFHPASVAALVDERPDRDVG